MYRPPTISIETFAVEILFYDLFDKYKHGPRISPLDEDDGTLVVSEEFTVKTKKDKDDEIESSKSQSWDLTNKIF